MTLGKDAGSKGSHYSPLTLCIDIGGSHLKASVLDQSGWMVADKVRVATPDPCPPEIMMPALVGLVEKLPAFDRVSVGFPGLVVHGAVITAPNLGNRLWRNFDLANELAGTLGKPVRLLNDAEVQGFGVIVGRGLELVLTLGTGAGTALFRHGELMPHLELAQHPIRGNKTYDEYIGNAALEKHGRKKWNRRVRRAIATLHMLLNYDVIYLGGGNAEELDRVPEGAFVVDNSAGITGGVKLWNAPEGQGPFKGERSALST